MSRINYWNEPDDQPEFDGPYLCYMERENECGTTSRYQKVVEFSFCVWLTLETEKVTHWRYLEKPPETNPYPA